MGEFLYYLNDIPYFFVIFPLQNPAGSELEFLC
jgi:hypothetical protein